MHSKFVHFVTGKNFQNITIHKINFELEEEIGCIHLEIETDNEKLEIK